MFKGYDIVKVMEPNGEEPSIVVLNPKLVRNKNETTT
jgi:3-methyladenine DNA glycosylase Tag